MNRRDFLKMSALFSAGLFIPLQLAAGGASSRAVEVSAGGLTLRGTREGDILQSRDGGKTWQLHTRLGKEFAVTRLTADRAQGVRARIGFAGRSFELALAKDGKHWVTV